MRAIIVKFESNEGARASVVFDRYGLNSGLFSHGYDHDQLIAHATSNALGAIIQKYGADWTKDYSIQIVD